MLSRAQITSSMLQDSVQAGLLQRAADDLTGSNAQSQEMQTHKELRIRILFAAYPFFKRPWEGKLQKDTDFNQVVCHADLFPFTFHDLSSKLTIMTALGILISGILTILRFVFLPSSTAADHNCM